jgi:hypothetical protein
MIVVMINTFLEQALLLVNAEDQEKLILSLLIEERVCLELQINLRIRASFVPMLQWRKRVIREKDEFMTD